MKRAIVIAAVAVLSACQTNPDTGKPTMLGPMPAAGVVAVDKAKSATVQVADAMPAGATSLGEIKGISCKNTPLDPTPTEERALAQLKQKALNAGATGVAAVKYEAGGTSLATNCWSTMTATGQAFNQAAK